MYRNVIVLALLSALVSIDSAAPCRADADTPSMKAGEVVSGRRFRGLLQRQNAALPGVDASAGQTGPHLQIAFAIDGTDSMGSDIRSVVDRVEDMVRGLGQIGLAAVVYRDTGSKSGSVVVYHNKFTESIKEFKETLGTIQVEAGTPYFEEQVDRGVEAALSGLAWNQGEDVVRWIIVFGDAPPHPRSKKKDNPSAGPDLDQLSKLAQRKKIQVHCVLCASGFVGALAGENVELKQVYEKLLPETRQFMQTLAEKSGGTFWDLTDDKLVAQLAKDAEDVSGDGTRVAKITPDDVERARQSDHQAWASKRSGAPVRIAVLPHLPLDKLSFDAANPAVQVATEFRERLRGLPLFQVKDAAAVKAKCESLAAEKADSDAERLAKIATSLHVDYLVWGRHDASDKRIRLQSAIYKRVDGEKLAEVEEIARVGESTAPGSAVGETSLVSAVAERLLGEAARKLGQQSESPGIAATFASLTLDSDLADQFVSPISTNIRARRELLSGLESLEQALAFVNEPSGEGRGLLLHARVQLGAAEKLEPDNPLVHLLLANCHLNLATAKISDDSTTDDAQAYRKELEEAYRLRDKVLHPTVRQEIEADYALVIQRDVEDAMQRYRALADAESAKNLNSALRAHWMLAGIFAGDWGVSEQYVDPMAAREQIIQILAHWQDSPEAEFYMKALGWDSQSGSDDKAIPNKHDMLVSDGAASAPQ